MTVSRPTSPHLTIYRPQITSILSIAHRITGIALYAGAVLLVFWLYAAAYEPEAFAQLHELLLTPLGRLALFGWTFAFFYHLTNGIRHLFWDMGKGFSLPTVTRSGVLVIFSATVLTVLTWAIAYHQAGLL